MNFQDHLKTIQTDNVAFSAREGATVVTLFSDLRGFSYYLSNSQDTDIINFLGDYYKIYTNAIEKVKWFHHNNSKIINYLEPKVKKHLGDGILLIWEIPNNRDLKYNHKVIIYKSIFDIVSYCQGYLQLLKNDFHAIGKYNGDVQELYLGFGLTIGTSKCIEVEKSQVDYIGKEINLASRLLNKARPGVILSRDFYSKFSELLTSQITSEEIGQLKEFEIFGNDSEKAKTWISTRIVNPIISDINYEDFYGIDIKQILPLIPDRCLEKKNKTIIINLPDENKHESVDNYLSDLSNLRQAIEILTTRILAFNVKNNVIELEALNEIDNIMNKQNTAFDQRNSNNFAEYGNQFHKTIASLTLKDTRSQELVEKLWEVTSVQNSLNFDKYCTEVIYEHAEIISKIKTGEVDFAETAIRNHLINQHMRKKGLIESTLKRTEET